MADNTINDDDVALNPAGVSGEKSPTLAAISPEDKKDGARPMSGVSDGVALAYFNRYKMIVDRLVKGGQVSFDSQTITDMMAYGEDEPSIIAPTTLDGMDFYGFMTSPETSDIVREGIIRNTEGTDRERQLAIFDLLETDAKRMEREYPRAMDGPVADAQAEHLAFVQTVNPEHGDAVLGAIGTNHETAQRVADAIVASMPEPQVFENFTAAPESDPTLPSPETPVTVPLDPMKVAGISETADSPPKITEAFNIAKENIADASILLNGNSKDDMAFLTDLVEEAKRMGVDPATITKIEADLTSKDFVRTDFAAKGVEDYSKLLKEALKDDGAISNVEYRHALGDLFNNLAGGMVVDRKGLADDVAAPKGAKEHALQSMNEVKLAL